MACPGAWKSWTRRWHSKMETKAGDPGAFAFRFDPCALSRLCRGRGRYPPESGSSGGCKGTVRGKNIIGAEGFFNVVTRACYRRISRRVLRLRPVGSETRRPAFQGLD